MIKFKNIDFKNGVFKYVMTKPYTQAKRTYRRNRYKTKRTLTYKEIDEIMEKFFRSKIND